MNIIYTYATALVTYLVIDFLWLGVVAKNLYRKELQPLLAQKVNWPAAFTFYALFIVGILYFCVYPAQTVSQAALKGALFGFFCYSTYELTNYALIKDWPAKIVYIDILWGTLLIAVVAAVAWLVKSTLL